MKVAGWGYSWIGATRCPVMFWPPLVDACLCFCSSFNILYHPKPCDLSFFRSFFIDIIPSLGPSTPICVSKWWTGSTQLWRRRTRWSRGSCRRSSTRPWPPMQRPRRTSPLPSPPVTSAKPRSLVDDWWGSAHIQASRKMNSLIRSVCHESDSSLVGWPQVIRPWWPCKFYIGQKNRTSKQKTKKKQEIKLRICI